MKKTTRKQRVDADGKMGVLQRLRGLPESVQEELFLRAQGVSAKTLIADLRAQHGIEGLSEQRLSDFWRWWDGQRKLRAAMEDAAQFREAFSREGTGASPEEIHIRTVDYLRMKGLREDDEKVLKFAVGEARRVMELERGARAEARALEELELKRENQVKENALASLRLQLARARMQLGKIAEEGLTDGNKDGVSALLAELEALGVQ